MKKSIMKFSKGLTPKCTSMNNGDTLGVVGSITTSTYNVGVIFLALAIFVTPRNI